MPNLAPSRCRDWSRDERAYVTRISTLCRLGTRLELDCQCTDEGDPWCIVYDRFLDRVVLHLARIDRRYVIAFPRQQRSETRASMAAICEIAVNEIDCIYHPTINTGQAFAAG
jgi:hypothetical protein